MIKTILGMRSIRVSSTPEQESTLWSRSYLNLERFFLPCQLRSFGRILSANVEAGI